MSIEIVSRLDLPAAATAGSTSTVGEPSVGQLDDSVLFTGNWYAATTVDGGNTWRHVDPFSFFPSADRGFCCDQTTLYDPTRDLFLWLLQYRRTDAGNTLRLAVKRGSLLHEEDDWYWWDLVPSQVNPAWANEWFDFNHAALSDDFLYVVTNAFQTTGAGRFTRCVAFRFPLDDLQRGTTLGLEYFSTDSFSLRCTQGARDVMYLGSHARTTPTRIRVFRWPENGGAVTVAEVPVTSWRGGNGYFHPGPDGHNWLGRCDPRITGGWVADGVVGFLWAADRQGSRPHPHVRVARIDEDSMTLLDEPDLWSRQVSFAYPDVSLNGDGELGVALFYGGGSSFPSHAVGAWNPDTGRWELRASRVGTDGPLDGKWGDYVTCRPGHSEGASWIATGLVLDGGAELDSVRPFLVRFTRT